MINSDWKQLTLKEYIEYLDYCNTENPNLLEYLEKRDLSKLSLFEKRLILSKWSFLAEDFYSYEIDYKQLPNLLEVDNKLYKIENNFEYLSTDQFTDMDDHIQDSFKNNNKLKHIHTILAIASMPDNTYRFKDVEKFSNILLERNMYEMIPHISFFFQPIPNSELNLKEYLIQTKQMLKSQIKEQIQNWSNSESNTVGGTQYTYWQKRKLQIMEKFVLKRLENL